VTARVGPDGLVELRSGQLLVELSPLGAGLRRVVAPDAQARPGDVHLRLADEATYRDPDRNPYVGVTVGRYANRISHARYHLDGSDVALVPNEGSHHLHGGPQGCARRDWDVLGVVSTADGGAVTFGLLSADGDQGHPGNLSLIATHEVVGAELHTTYSATTDAPTPVNLCLHPYWNLDGTPTVHDHELAVAAPAALPVDDELIPTGGPVPVDGGPRDLRVPVRLGDTLAVRGDGFDDCLVLRDPTADLARPSGSPTWVAVLRGARSGRWLALATDQPGLQLYTGGSLEPPLVRHGAVALEPQRLPDAPNHPEWGDVVLRPGETYRSRSILRFGTGPAPWALLADAGRAG
jgi:aldose 1-epimerase